MANILTPEQIRTASLYPLATLHQRIGANNYPVIVTRYWPRFAISARTGFHPGAVEALRATWRDVSRALAPSAALLKRYHADGDWEAFADAYRAEVAPLMDDARQWLADCLLHLFRDGAQAVLLCHEHDAPEDTVRCHRRLLREMLLETDGEA